MQNHWVAKAKDNDAAARTYVYDSKWTKSVRFSFHPIAPADSLHLSREALQESIGYKSEILHSSDELL
jgi:hypothetical protein